MRKADAPDAACSRADTGLPAVPPRQSRRGAARGARPPRAGAADAAAPPVQPRPSGRCSANGISARAGAGMEAVGLGRDGGAYLSRVQASVVIKAALFTVRNGK